jgi:hypothetical protein
LPNSSGRSSLVDVTICPSCGHDNLAGKFCGTDNGLPVSFTAIGVDNGATTLDTFSLTLSDGYSNIGNLLDGTTTLR